MLENPRNVEFDIYVMDDVFPEDEHVEFLKLIRELNGDWKPRIDDLDVFWFAWKEEHPGRKYLMHLLMKAQHLIQARHEPLHYDNLIFVY